jgi:DNA-binding phage protein
MAKKRKKTKMELEAYHTVEMAKSMLVLSGNGGLARSLIHAMSMSSGWSIETIGRVRQALNLP